MKLETRVFELASGKFKSLSELAEAMGAPTKISLAQIYRVRQGKREIGEKFIIGAVKAFPEYKLDDLFYVPDGTEVDRRNDLRERGNLASTRDARRDEIVKLRDAGLTYAEIGSRFGITKERVRQILNEKPEQKPEQKPAPDSNGMLTARETARFLNVHINTVRHWSNRGILKSYRIGSRGDRRFRREDVDDFLARERRGKLSNPAGEG